jgi:hypothetical protein
LNLRILLGHELYDEVLATRREEARQIIEWNIIGDREVVNQRERQNEIGWSTIKE